MNPKQQKQLLHSIMVSLHALPRIDTVRLDRLHDELSEKLSEGAPDGKLALERAVATLDVAIQEIHNLIHAADATKRLCTHAAQCLQAQEAKGLGGSGRGELVLVGDGTAVWRTGRVKPVNL